MKLAYNGIICHKSNVKFENTSVTLIRYNYIKKNKLTAYSTEAISLEHATLGNAICITEAEEVRKNGGSLWMTDIVNNVYSRLAYSKKQRDVSECNLRNNSSNLKL